MREDRHHAACSFAFPSAASRPSCARSRALDLEPWRELVTFRAFGTRIAIRTEAGPISARVRSILLPTWQTTRQTGENGRADLIFSVVSDHGAGFALFEGADRVLAGASEEQLLRALEQRLHIRVAGLSSDCLFLHAGAVARNGRALLVVGRTHSGKSTMIEALTGLGATYLSDDLVPLDRRGRAHAYPKTLSLRGPEPRRIPASELGWRRDQKPVAVKAILLCSYRPGASFEPKPLPPGRAALELLRHTVSARRRAAWALTLLPWLAGRAPVIRGAHGDAARLAPWLCSLLDATAQDTSSSTEAEASCA